MNDRARRLAIATLIAIVLLAFTAWRIQAFRALHAPALLTYIGIADAINRGVMPLGQMGDVSPVYLWLVVVLRKVGLGVRAIASLQIVALTLSAVSCAFVAKRIAGWTAAIATAALILGNRAAFVQATELDPKTLIFFLTSAALALLTINRTPATIAAAILLGLNAVTHPYGYLILIVVAIVHRRAALLAAVLPIVLVLVLTPKTAPHSSSQLYEGNNPLATGAGGVVPRVVADLQVRIGALSPDPVYRMLGVDWRAKALANLRTYPAAALKRFGWKALLTIHNYDVFDIITAQQTNRRLPRAPSIPFGAACALAIAAFVLRRERRELLPFALIAIVLMLALTLFVVSARQRNIVLVPVAILGGIGAAEIIALARKRSDRALLAFGAVLIATALLGIEGNPMREHQYKWTGRAAPDSPEVLFDRARALEENGAWPQAESVLSTITEYQPLRENRAVSSVAYYRARAALRLRVPPTVIAELLDRAEREAPGDPLVLALRALTIDPDAARTLDELHDPLTRDFALAAAQFDLGQTARGLALMNSLNARLKGHVSRTTANSGTREAGR
ncbi:MAG TPA: hypothetical protein VF787_08815 [Thermoanaerobaculia bacterium]